MLVELDNAPKRSTYAEHFQNFMNLVYANCRDKARGVYCPSKNLVMNISVSAPQNVDKQLRKSEEYLIWWHVKKAFHKNDNIVSQ